jgi:hypothetical protein
MDWCLCGGGDKISELSDVIVAMDLVWSTGSWHEPCISSRKTYKVEAVMSKYVVFALLTMFCATSSWANSDLFTDCSNSSTILGTNVSPIDSKKVDECILTFSIPYQGIETWVYHLVSTRVQDGKKECLYLGGSNPSTVYCTLK